MRVGEDYAPHITLGPSKLENAADPGSGPRGPLPKIRVHYLNLNGAV